MANLHHHASGIPRIFSAEIPVGDQRAFVRLSLQTESQKIGEEQMEVCLKLDTSTFGVSNCKEGGHFIHKMSIQIHPPASGKFVGASPSTKARKFIHQTTTAISARVGCGGLLNLFALRIQRESGVGWSTDAFGWSASADPLGNQSVSWVWTLDRWQDGRVFPRIPADTSSLFFRRLGSLPFSADYVQYGKESELEARFLLPQKDDDQKWSIQIEFSVARFRSFWPWPLVRGFFSRPLIHTEAFSLVPPALASGRFHRPEAKPAVPVVVLLPV
ncbi:hypothetical protein R1flu_024611 [Riccia fluitans]|uniref:Uncharacterized protein n=1 Tax=Riccia fluitans TaxID=41844 RepID=A0ABD1XVE4_9MARC